MHFSPQIARDQRVKKRLKVTFLYKRLESAENENTIIKKIVRCLITKNEGV